VWPLLLSFPTKSDGRGDSHAARWHGLRESEPVENALINEHCNGKGPDMRIASIETIIVDLPTCRPHHLAMATINSLHRARLIPRSSSDRVLTLFAPLPKT
jgi:hypothetical protein